MQDYAVKLIASLVDVIGAALGDLQPAEIAYGVGEAGFAMNRREMTPQGVKIGVNPQGPVDRSVPVLRVTAGGKLKAVLFGYACHNTTLTGEFLSDQRRTMRVSPSCHLRSPIPARQPCS